MRAVLVSLFVLVSLTAGWSAAVGRVGFGKVDITPSFPVQMGGYGYRVSAGVHDRLYARAAVFAVGDRKAAIVGVDFLLINRDLGQAIAAEVTRLTGIPTDALLICASHSHSAPWNYAADLTLDPRELDARLVEHCRSRIPMAVLAAYRALQPAEIGFAQRTVAGINTNRRSDQDPLDRDLTLLVARTPGGKVLGGVANFTAHPVIMGESNLELSAEWPGAAMTTLEREVGKAAVFVFAQGCAGDVTIKRNGSTFAEVKRVGEEIGRAFAEMLPGMKYHPLVSLGWARATAMAPVKPKFDAAGFKAEKARLEQEVAAAKAAGNETLLKDATRRLENVNSDAELLPVFERMPRFQGDKIEIQARAISLNDCALVGIGSEALNRIGLEIKAGLADTHTLVAGYCNDWAGYVPMREDYPKGGYEVSMNRFAPGAGEKMVALGIRAAKEAARRAKTAFGRTRPPLSPRRGPGEGISGRL